jgi:KDO2-lipid IV(A) lauroyltransferase
MQKNFIIDYASCIGFRLLSPVIRALPLKLALFLGRMIGELLYAFDLKHKARAYANIRVALGDKLSPSGLKALTKEFYRTFGQSLIEIFLLPVIDKKYLDKYISIEGLSFIQEAFKEGKGVIFAAIHSGSWELSNLICANLGFKFYLVVREQRYPLLDNLLNIYRKQKGCQLIHRQNQTRSLIQALKDNQAIGITVDQGGRTGTPVEFFGKDASMASGAVRLALRYDAVILPAYYTRINGPYLKLIIEQPFKLKKTGNQDKDVKDNLQELSRAFEKLILKFPKDYLWTYKIWKYGRQKNILILNDGKTGHLRQSQAVSESLNKYLKDKSMSAIINTVEVKFKNKLSRLSLDLSSCLSGKYQCQGCLWCLKTFLEPDVYKSLIKFTPDIIISCGSSLAAINYVLSRENLSKSIVIMRPSFLSTRRFNLVIMPRHDSPRKRKNIVVSEGALNLINENYLKDQAQALKPEVSITKELVLGLLVGGNTKEFYLNQEIMRVVISQIKESLEKYDGQILTTTSRRTPSEIEMLLKDELESYSRSRLLIIANKNNSPHALGGILALSKILVVSPESISMISEAASAEKYVIVFKSRIDKRHSRFLDYMAAKKYIYLCEASGISSVIKKILEEKPAINVLSDNLKVSEDLKRLI